MATQIQIGNTNTNWQPKYIMASQIQQGNTNTTGKHKHNMATQMQICKKKIQIGKENIWALQHFGAKHFGQTKISWQIFLTSFFAGNNFFGCSKFFAKKNLGRENKLQCKIIFDLNKMAGKLKLWINKIFRQIK